MDSAVVAVCKDGMRGRGAVRFGWTRVSSMVRGRGCFRTMVISVLLQLGYGWVGRISSRMRNTATAMDSDLE